VNTFVPAVIDGAAVATPGGDEQLAALTEIWLRSFKSMHTRAAYRRDLTAWAAWCGRLGIEPNRARIAHADLWIEQQRQDGSADRTIARRMAAVSSWYDYLIVNTAGDPVPLAVANPGKTKARPKIDRRYTPTVSLSRDEADRIIDEADAESLLASALIRLLLAEGLRIGSAIGADISALGHDKGHRILTLGVKGGHEKKVPLPPFVSGPLDDMLASRGNPAGGPLFVTPREGVRVYELYVWRLVRRLGRRAEVPQAAQLSPHSLRHTAITQLLESGAALHEAQDFAGHADPRTTQLYNHSRKGLDDHGSYRLAARFGARRDS